MRYKKIVKMYLFITFIVAHVALNLHTLDKIVARLGTLLFDDNAYEMWEVPMPHLVQYVEYKFCNIASF